MEPIPPGLRERKKIETRLALARAAMRLFEERGYAATTVDDIAAAANVSRRTFFRYFASKDEVFIVDPEGKLAALHIALAGRSAGRADDRRPPPRGRGARRARTSSRSSSAPRRESSAREPAIAAAGLAYQVRWEDALAHEVATDLGVDVDMDPRPRIVAHTTVAIMRAGVAHWLQGGCAGDAADVGGRHLRRGDPGARGGPGDAAGAGPTG